MNQPAMPVLNFTGHTHYALPLPFHPPESYPELTFLGAARCPENGIYAGVRRMLQAKGYDAGRFGSPDWSPLSPFVGPGKTVVIKPNFVRHFNETHGDNVEAVVTHLSVLRPLIDYAYKAVGSTGRVVIADAPQYDCELDVLLERIQMPDFLAFYREKLGLPLEFHDLRVAFGRHIHGVQTERRKLAGDPMGYVAVDLADASEFSSLPDPLIHVLRGADYDEEVTIRHHSEGRNEYLVSRTVLEADLVVNVPKLKTHKKAGVTLSMKNLIGINGDKNWLPHYRMGFVRNGGDEFPHRDLYSRIRGRGAELARQLLKRGVGSAIFRRLRAMENASGLGDRTRAGNWYGNDTIWRTCIDLNKIFYHADAEGRIDTGSRRRVLNVYDGIVAGEGRGPMGPDSRPLGLLALCEDGGAADVVLTWIMGFDWTRIPLLRNAFGELAGGLPISSFRGNPKDLNVLWIDDDGERERCFAEIALNLHFEPHPGWKGRIERPASRMARNSCAS